MPPISISLNVTKLDKERFFKGKKGIYADLILFETPDSDYGDYMVKQRADKGQQMPILGNAKVFKTQGKQARNEPKNNDKNDQIPF